MKLFVLKAGHLLCSVLVIGYGTAQPAKPFADELYHTRQLPASSNLLSVLDTAKKETSDKRGGIDEGGTFPARNKVRCITAQYLQWASSSFSSCACSYLGE